MSADVQRCVSFCTLGRVAVCIGVFDVGTEAAQGFHQWRNGAVAHALYAVKNDVRAFGGGEESCGKAHGCTGGADIYATIAH